MEEPAPEVCSNLHPLLKQHSGSLERKVSNGSYRRSSPRITWKRPTSTDICPDLSLAPKLGLAAIIAMVFFNVSGGPWGSEDIFSKSDPLIGVFGILLFTVTFCLPQTLMTAELCCALPSNGGYSIWVREAFGDFWCFQETYWQFVSGVADAAVYPVLVCDTILQLLDVHHLSTADKLFWRGLTTVLLSLPTYVSGSNIPSLLVTLGIVTGVPVIAFICVGLARFDPAVLSEGPAGGEIHFGKFINVLFWSLEGWDCISTCSGLCAEPREKTIPKGLFIAMVITSLQYVLVLLAGTAISPGKHPWEDWSDGTLPSIARSCGSVMSISLLVASLAGNAGQYLSEFIEGSYLLQGAAEVDIVPRVLGKQLPKSGVPYMANTAQLFIILWLMTFDFSDILVFDNFFCANGIAMEFAAFFVLRWKRPDLERPFKAPGMLLPLFVPASAIIVVVWFNCFFGKAMLVNASAFALGIPYGLWVAAKSRKEHEEGHAKSAFDCWVEDDD